MRLINLMMRCATMNVCRRLVVKAEDETKNECDC